MTNHEYRRSLINSFTEMQTGLASHRSEFENLLNTSWKLQMQCYLADMQDCVADYNDMRIRLEEVIRQEQANEITCIQSMKLKTPFSFRDQIDSKTATGELNKLLQKIRPCFEFAHDLIAEELEILRAGIKTTEEHLNKKTN